MEENYKEKQKKYKELYKNRGRVLWYSTDPTNPLAGGKTFIKPKEEKEKEKKSCK